MLLGDDDLDESFDLVLLGDDDLGESSVLLYILDLVGLVVSVRLVDVELLPLVEVDDLGPRLVSESVPLSLLGPSSMPLVLDVVELLRLDP